MDRVTDIVLPSAYSQTLMDLTKWEIFPLDPEQLSPSYR